MGKALRSHLMRLLGYFEPEGLGLGFRPRGISIL